MLLSELVIKTDKTLAATKDFVLEDIAFSAKDIIEAINSSVKNCKSRNQLSTFVRKIESLGVCL